MTTPGFPAPVTMSAPSWYFEADYFTFCNCDWGCPCNFNARPTEGHCHGGGVWNIRRGAFGPVKLDGAKLAIFYWFPGLIEQGNATARTYIDRGTTPEQRTALGMICDGKAGGGMFELFHSLASKFHPTIVTDIEFAVDGDGKDRVRVGDYWEAESELLAYPDGTTIRPMFTLPHGIEFKTGLATNAKRWWIRDEDMLANHHDKYGVIAKVRFTEQGCVA